MNWPHFSSQFMNWANLYAARFMKLAISQTGCNVYTLLQSWLRFVQKWL